MRRAELYRGWRRRHGRQPFKTPLERAKGNLFEISGCPCESQYTPVLGLAATDAIKDGPRMPDEHAICDNLLKTMAFWCGCERHRCMQLENHSSWNETGRRGESHTPRHNETYLLKCKLKHLKVRFRRSGCHPVNRQNVLWTGGHRDHTVNCGPQNHKISRAAHRSLECQGAF